MSAKLDEPTIWTDLWSDNTPMFGQRVWVHDEEGALLQVRIVGKSLSHKGMLICSRLNKRGLETHDYIGLKDIVQGTTVFDL